MSTETSRLPHVTLPSGAPMPVIGLGVYQIPAGAPTQQAVLWALEAGYRHIDTAALYRNERDVGRALAASGLPRQDVFVTTKLLPMRRDARDELEASLERLGLDQVDLYLIHWPTGPMTLRHWDALAEAQRDGLARDIGVSNHGLDELEAVRASSDVAPAVNQVQFSPFRYRRALLEYCQAHGIAFEAYSPLTQGRSLNHPVVAAIAAAHARTPAQVMLRWAIQRGAIVIPKSADRGRITSNLDVDAFALSPAELDRLDALDETGRTERAR